MCMMCKLLSEATWECVYEELPYNELFHPEVTTCGWQDINFDEPSTVKMYLCNSPFLVVIFYVATCIELLPLQTPSQWNSAQDNLFIHIVHSP